MARAIYLGTSSIHLCRSTDAVRQSGIYGAAASCVPRAARSGVSTGPREGQTRAPKRRGRCGRYHLRMLLELLQITIIAASAHLQIQQQLTYTAACHRGYDVIAQYLH